VSFNNLLSGNVSVMKNFFFILIVLLSACSATNKSQQPALWQPVDFTAENLFSKNIESPAFDKVGNLYVVNFQKDGTVGQIKQDGTGSVFIELPVGSIANSIKFDNKGSMYLADFPKHNVLKVDMKTKQVSTFVHRDDFNQPNDLCINKRDQLFASDPNWKESTGKLWRIDPNGTAVLLTDQMGTANGIELSPDEKILYVNESVQRKVWAFDVDASGNISNKRLFAEFPDFGFDGMKCDKKGNLYICRHGKGTIVVMSPTGKQIREIALKGKLCSNLVFGGKGGKEVFVTLQDRMGMEKFLNDIPGKGY
jgi:gluconolactonase